MEYVTPMGLKRKTLQELRTETENGLKAVFGVSFETAVDSPNGLLISQLSMAFANFWELAQEVYSSLDPNQATGTALDARAALNGVVRKAAEACSVTAVVYTDSASETIPAGSIANRQRGDLNFALDEDVPVSRSLCAELVIQDDGSLKNTEYIFKFTFGDVTLDNTLPLPNLTVLMGTINTSGGVAELIPGLGLRVRGVGGAQVGIVAPLPDDFVILAGNPGKFTATETGLQTCEIGELDNIPSSVPGWAAVYNYEAGTPGADIESDASLRIRREAAAKIRKSRATDPAIEAALLGVAGVTSAEVKSNRTFTMDADGIPGKAFTSLVVGGTDAAVARCIYENQPAGIEPWGNTTVMVTDSKGMQHAVSFTRPTPVYLWVKVTYTLYDEEAFTGVDAMKAALVEWAAREYTLGKDIISTRLGQGLYEVPGIGVATFEVGTSSAPETAPGTYYSDAQIPVSSFNYAVLEEDRITCIEAP